MKKEQIKINDGHYTEMLDRIHIQMEIINDHLIQHPVAQQNKTLKRLLIRALTTLYKAYQETGAITIKNDKNVRKHKLRK